MQTKYKAIIEYILRVIIFLILTAFLQDKICNKIIDILQEIPTIIYEKYPIFVGDDNAQIVLSIIIGVLSLFISLIGVTYYFAKITGIFKKLDSLKKWQGVFVLILIGIISNIIGIFLNEFKLFNFDIRTNIEFVGFPLIPSYLFYLYFQFLTKKYPTPFEKIGYYCSIEFYRGLFKRILSEIKKKG